MKPIEKLTNVERARLLHQLFPQEMPAFVKYVKGVAEIAINEQEQHKAKWTNHLLTFDFWLTLATTIDRIIDKYADRLPKSNRLFADQLFDGYNAMFMLHCLETYTTIHKSENEKFNQAISLLFL